MNKSTETQVRQLKKAPLYGAFFVLLMTLISTVVVFSSIGHATESTKVRVKKVVDGDTVRLENGKLVRLLGINTPERTYDDQPADPFSLEATLLLQELVEGREVVLTPGREKKDKYGRLLGYLNLLDGSDVQQQLIKRGYAFVVAFPPDIDRLKQFVPLEKTARKQKKGVWGDSFYTPVPPEDHVSLDGGFRLVTGKITKVGSSKKNVRLSIGSDLVVGVRHSAWNEFWQIAPESLLGQTVVARGWISKGSKGDPAYLRIRHPAMMEIE